MGGSLSISGAFLWLNQPSPPNFSKRNNHLFSICIVEGITQRKSVHLSHLLQMDVVFFFFLFFKSIKFTTSVSQNFIWNPRSSNHSVLWLFFFSEASKGTIVMAYCSLEKYLFTALSNTYGDWKWALLGKRWLSACGKCCNITFKKSWVKSESFQGFEYTVYVWSILSKRMW